jgi:hypothetical protein
MRRITAGLTALGVRLADGAGVWISADHDRWTPRASAGRAQPLGGRPVDADLSKSWVMSLLFPSVRQSSKSNEMSTS